MRTCERGTWNVERANVRTWNVRTCERGRRRARTGTPVHGARPHSFIRSPFVDSRDGTGNVERGTCERANVRTWNVERGTWNVERANVGAGARGRGHRCTERDHIRLFVLHSLTAGMAQGTWNVERANVGAGARGRGHGCTERDHIRLFVLHSLTAGMAQGAWNVRTCERANVGAGARGRGHGCTERDHIRLFVLHSLTAGMAQGTWNVERANVERANVQRDHANHIIPYSNARPCSHQSRNLIIT